MTYEYGRKFRVKFSDTDMAGIMHFSNFFRYMEETEHEFLRSLGLSVHAAIDGQWVSWPRVSTGCTFRAPLRFEDEFEVRLLVRSKRSPSITYDFLFIKEGVEEPVARGSITVVCASLDKATHSIRSTPIPECIDREIDVAPDELLAPARDRFSDK